ncbi:antimicrobial peptide ABC transporter permease SapC [Psychromonas marina]|uniref:Antimicrobial peptide ABC transporter permease SapC n=1 Tax=Psychromonas marina TaxID=88364 RepID=A0ABQ6E1R5_9GAMM|nr:ABC transporter permease subunit [Psychromonas marina]GLS91334.1 antimicrobial peptide ABC transporter permease SapC [Psychromonas marina]
MLINNEFNEEKIQSPQQYIWSIFKSKNIAVVSMWAVVALILIAIFCQYIMPYPPALQHPDMLLLPPYWVDGSNPAHLLGTDDLGRDTFSRLLKGIQLTLTGALLITVAISLLGLIIGSTAALLKGVKASIVHHLLDALLTIPTLLTALILIVLFGMSFENSLLAVSLSLLPQFIRGIYNCIETELNKQYVVALRLDGSTNLRLLRYGILPNIIEPIVTLLNRIFTMAVLEITTLGFLGFGANLEEIELGALIAKNLDLIYISPYLVLFPGLAIFMIIIIFNIFAEGIRHAVIEGED